MADFCGVKFHHNPTATIEHQKDIARTKWFPGLKVGRLMRPRFSRSLVVCRQSGETVLKEFSNGIEVLFSPLNMG